MKTDFAGKTALVTGGGNGIGRASASDFAARGARVVVSDIDEASGQEVVAAIREAGGTAEFVACDVTKEAQVRSLIDRTIQLFGRLDYAHNNAGCMFGPADFGGCSVDEWDRTQDLSLKGIWLCMRAQLPVMASQGGGVIVNTTSMAGVRYAPAANAAYCAAKAGVISLTEYAAVRHAADNIRVNAIAPGLVRTKIVDSMYTKAQQDEMAGATQPIGRIIEPEEVASGVIFLCSSQAAMITGATLPIAGGYNAA